MSNVDIQLLDIVTRTKAAIGDLLGVFSDGLPAVTVEPPEDLRRKSATGLMATIQREPVGRVDRLSGSSAFSDQCYLLSLIEFDRESINLAAASLRIKYEFVLDRSIHSPATDESYEQIVFWVCAPVFISN